MPCSFDPVVADAIFWTFRFNLFSVPDKAQDLPPENARKVLYVQLRYCNLIWYGGLFEISSSTGADTPVWTFHGLACARADPAAAELRDP
jgi:hypothetical protein